MQISVDLVAKKSDDKRKICNIWQIQLGNRFVNGART